MAVRKYRRLGVLAKLEAVYGTDAVPTAAANAIQLTNITFTPLAGSEEKRDLIVPWMGHQGVYLTDDYVEAKFDVEIAGSGAAGTAPAWGALMRACGHSETIVAGASVTYAPVSSDEESLTLYWNEDGVRHVGLGGRGTVSLSLAAEKIPRFTFDMKFLVGTITDQALPTADLAAWIDPVIVNTDHTTMSAFGAAQVVESLSLDQAGTVEVYHRIGQDTVEITDRQSTGTLVVQAASLATKDWFALARARTRGALAVTHGTAAGNIIDIAAPAVEIGRPSPGNTKGIRNYSLPLMLCADAGDDEYTIVAR